MLSFSLFIFFHFFFITTSVINNTEIYLWHNFGTSILNAEINAKIDLRKYRLRYI